MTLPNKGPYAHFGAGKTIAEWGAELEALNGRVPGIVAEVVYGASEPTPADSKKETNK